MYNQIILAFDSSIPKARMDRMWIGEDLSIETALMHTIVFQQYSVDDRASLSASCLRIFDSQSYLGSIEKKLLLLDICIQWHFVLTLRKVIFLSSSHSEHFRCSC